MLRQWGGVERCEEYKNDEGPLMEVGQVCVSMLALSSTLQYYPTVTLLYLFLEGDSVHIQLDYEVLHSVHHLSRHKVLNRILTHNRIPALSLSL